MPCRSFQYASSLRNALALDADANLELLMYNNIGRMRHHMTLGLPPSLASGEARNARLRLMQYTIMTQLSKGSSDLTNPTISTSN